MANAPIYRHIVLTGAPGVGKTTLIRKTCDELKKRHIPVQGFYTEECRQGSHRIGFDVVTLDGNRQPLARLDELTDQATARCRVGKYCVLKSSFEECALPTLTLPKGPCQLPIIVVDEIGKMELFSSEFEQAVSQLLSHTSVTLLGTIPQKRAIAVKFADKVRSSPTVHLFEITKENRRHVGDEIVAAVIRAYETQQ